MKLEDLGIDSKTETHDARLTWTENVFLGLLWIDHEGHANRISADELAVRFGFRIRGLDMGKTPVDRVVEGHRLYNRSLLEEWKRDVRHLQNHLLEKHENVPVLSRAGIGGGYWIAGAEEEVELFYASFRKRGLTGLKKAARGKKAVLTEIVEQLTFDFDDLDDRSGQAAANRGGAGTSAPVAVVDAFLKRMLNDPDRYAVGLRMIAKKYGGVLLPKGRIEAMQEKARELAALVEGMA